MKAVVARTLATLLPVTLAAGCTFDTSGQPPPALDDGGLPPPPADADLTCDPVADQVCLDANTLQECDSAGFATVTCAEGCVGDAGDAHCKGFSPSNGFDVTWLSRASAAFDIPGDDRWVFVTGTGVIFNCKTTLRVREAGVGLKSGVRFEIVPGRGGSPPIGVFALESLHVRGGGDVVAIGPNAFGLLVNGEVRIEETLRAGAGISRCTVEAACGAPLAGASRRCAGPGGFAGGNANESGLGPGGGESIPGGNGVAFFEFGGGGGGFAGTGGNGGSDGGGDGGTVYGELDLDPLLGGSGGGGGGQGGNLGGSGGGGGGAVQITSLTRIRVDANGGLEAGGAGGGPGKGTDGAGGGGAGAGGAILLEAPELRLEGELAANGGGGGGGNASGGSFGESEGAIGTFGLTPAAGGAGFYAGGAGAAGSANASGAKGAPALGTIDGTGGGGGSVGRILLRTIMGGLTQGSSVLITPPATVTLDLVR